jgi:hypothetical protein
MSEPKSDLERRAENYRIALGRIVDLCGDAAYCLQDILEIASDALAEDMQSPAKGDAQLATDLHFAEL